MAWLKRKFFNQDEVIVEKIREIQGWGINHHQLDNALLKALPVVDRPGTAKRLIGESKSFEVICNCLDILKNHPEGQAYACEALKNWKTGVYEIVAVSLRIAPLENSRPVIEAVLAAPLHEHRQLRFSILYRNFMGIPAWQRQTRYILKTGNGKTAYWSGASCRITTRKRFPCCPFAATSFRQALRK